MRLRLTKAGRKIVRTSPRRSLIGAFEIRNSVGAILSFRINIDLGARIRGIRGSGTRSINMEIFMKAFSYAVYMALALPLAAQAIVIDNGIPEGTPGHFSADIGTGGATSRVVFAARGFDSPEVVTTYQAFADVGNNGAEVLHSGGPAFLFQEEGQDPTDLKNEGAIQVFKSHRELETSLESLTFSEICSFPNSIKSNKRA